MVWWWRRTHTYQVPADGHFKICECWGLFATQRKSSCNLTQRLHEIDQKTSITQSLSHCITYSMQGPMLCNFNLVRCMGIFFSSTFSSKVSHLLTSNTFSYVIFRAESESGLGFYLWRPLEAAKVAEAVFHLELFHADSNSGLGFNLRGLWRPLKAVSWGCWGHSKTLNTFSYVTSCAELKFNLRFDLRVEFCKSQNRNQIQIRIQIPKRFGWPNPNPNPSPH